MINIIISNLKWNTEKKLLATRFVVTDPKRLHKGEYYTLYVTIKVVYYPPTSQLRHLDREIKGSVKIPTFSYLRCPAVPFFVPFTCSDFGNLDLQSRRISIPQFFFLKYSERRIKQPFLSTLNSILQDKKYIRIYQKILSMNSTSFLSKDMSIFKKLGSYCKRYSFKEKLLTLHFSTQ